VGTGRRQGKPKAGGQGIRPAGTKPYAGQVESALGIGKVLPPGQGLLPPEADFGAKLIFL